ncbi:hypothetical protein QE443_000635 [Pantoea ananatis]|nr:hypothetical protein [Pantoea ananatis]
MRTIVLPAAIARLHVIAHPEGKRINVAIQLFKLVKSISHLLAYRQLSLIIFFGCRNRHQPAQTQTRHRQYVLSQSGNRLQHDARFAVFITDIYLD